MGSQRGAGTLMAAVVVAVLMLIAGVGVFAAVVALAQRDADNAADLSALSGAAAFAAGQDPCPAARRIAASNGVEVRQCRVIGDLLDFVVTVEVQRRVTLVLGVEPTVRSEARAGRLGSAH
ncbi:MAG TPA: hypothetical protein DCM67_10930 [Propionibacteriaceae bacterium]|nr:hypothetical protein [Propionibacteriaceae bacterium]